MDVKGPVAVTKDGGLGSYSVMSTRTFIENNKTKAFLTLQNPEKTMHGLKTYLILRIFKKVNIKMSEEHQTSDEVTEMCLLTIL